MCTKLCTKSAGRPPLMSLNNKQLNSISANGRQYELPDRDGLSIRISPKGLISFQYRFRFNGCPQRIRYGRYPHLTLKEARAVHGEARALLERGINPITHRREQSLARLSDTTVEELCHDWLARYANGRRRRSYELRLMLKKNVYPTIGSLPILQVHRREVSKLVFDPILARGAPIQANKVLQLLKQIFDYGVEHGYCDSNPIARIRKNSVGGPEKPRTRVLSENEVAIFWRRIKDTNISIPVQLALKLLLVTGQRRGEITRSAWRDVDFTNRIWKIPAENSKSKREHEVPLSHLALQIFSELEKHSFNSPWVLPSFSKIHHYHLEENTLSRAVTRNLDKIGIAKWTPHDLRRTFVTQLNELGVSPYVVEKLVNHRLQGIMAVYNHANYWTQQVNAMDTWSEHLSSLIVTCENKSAPT